MNANFKKKRVKKKNNMINVVGLPGQPLMLEFVIIALKIRNIIARIFLLTA